MAAGAELDDIDLEIVARLGADARVAVLEIARGIGVPETTVRKRLQRLLSRGLLRVTAAPSPAALGYSREIMFGITTVRSRATEVARELAALPSVRFAAFGLGAFDLVVAAAFRGDDDLVAFITGPLAAADITAYQSMEVLDVFKRSDDWVVYRESPTSGQPRD